MLASIGNCSLGWFTPWAVFLAGNIITLCFTHVLSLRIVSTLSIFTIPFAPDLDITKHFAEDSDCIILLLLLYSGIQSHTLFGILVKFPRLRVS